MSDDGLVAFLRARLDEDEAAAKPCEHSWVTAADPLTAAFSHRFDAKRMLREIEAKRAILAEHMPYDCTEPKGQRCFRCASDRAYRSGAAIHEAWPCLTLRSLAAVYSDHPDYRPEWKP